MVIDIGPNTVLNSDRSVNQQVALNAWMKGEICRKPLEQLGATNAAAGKSV